MCRNWWQYISDNDTLKNKKTITKKQHELCLDIYGNM